MRAGKFGQDQPDAVAMCGEFVAQGLQVVHFVPLEFVQVQDQPALAARQRVLDALRQSFGVGRRERAFQSRRQSKSRCPDLGR